MRRTKLFQAIVVLGAAISAPATLATLTAVTMSGCDDGDQGDDGGDAIWGIVDAAFYDLSKLPDLTEVDGGGTD